MQWLCAVCVLHPPPSGGMICSRVAGWRSPPFLFRLTTKEYVRSKTMSEQIPSMGSLHQPPEKIKSLLSWVRETLQMDVAFVSEFAGNSWSSERWRGMRDPSDGE